VEHNSKKIQNGSRDQVQIVYSAACKKQNKNKFIFQKCLQTSLKGNTNVGFAIKIIGCKIKDQQ